VRAPSGGRPVRDKRDIVRELVSLWGLNINTAGPDLTEKLRWPIWGDLAKFRVPKTFSEDVTKALDALRTLRRRYKPLLGAGYFGGRRGDGLDTAIERLNLWSTMPRPEPHLEPLKAAVAQVAWVWAPQGRRAKRYHESAAALIYEYHNRYSQPKTHSRL
jgi:hypothetical protein